MQSVVNKTVINNHEQQLEPVWFSRMWLNVSLMCGSFYGRECRTNFQREMCEFDSRLLTVLAHAPHT